MKRILCVMLVMLLLIPCAFADEIDLSGMSVDDLKALRDRIDAELAARPAEPIETVILDSADALVVLKSCEHVPAYLSERDKYVVTIEWTNRTKKSAALDQFVTVEIYQDGVRLEQTESKTDTLIRPNTTMEARVSAVFGLSANKIEVVFLNADTETEYNVITINRD